MIFLFAVYFVIIMTLVITFLLSKKSYKKPVIKYIPTLILFILAVISSVMFVLNNGMGELMIAVSLGIAAIVNGLLQSSSCDCCKRKIEHRISMLYFLCIKKSLFMRDFNVVRRLIDRRTRFRINTQAGEQHGIVLLPFS